MPTIRHLCKAFSTPAAAPHVFVGVCSVLALHKSSQPTTTSPSRVSTRIRRSAAGPTPAQSKIEPIAEPRIPGLIAALLFYVLARMVNKETTPDQYLEQRDKAISTLGELEVGKESGEESIQTDIEHFMREAQAEAWLKMEWFLNVVAGQPAVGTGSGEGGEQVGVEEYDEDDGGTVQGLSQRKRTNGGVWDERSSNGGLQIGLGTMMQDKVDYLCEDRQLDYLEWKAKIMARVEQIESGQTENGSGDDMDTTT
jgi:origin recognition complex subunit 6